jgi:hypothetical protein
MNRSKHRQRPPFHQLRDIVAWKIGPRLPSWTSFPCTRRRRLKLSKEKDPTCFISESEPSSSRKAIEKGRSRHSKRSGKGLAQCTGKSLRCSDCNAHKHSSRDAGTSAPGTQDDCGAPPADVAGGIYPRTRPGLRVERWASELGSVIPLANYIVNRPSSVMTSSTRSTASTAGKSADAAAKSADDGPRCAFCGARPGTGAKPADAARPGTADIAFSLSAFF